MGEGWAGISSQSRQLCSLPFLVLCSWPVLLAVKPDQKALLQKLWKTRMHLCFPQGGEPETQRAQSLCLGNCWRSWDLKPLFTASYTDPPFRWLFPVKGDSLAVWNQRAASLRKEMVFV